MMELDNQAQINQLSWEYTVVKNEQDDAFPDVIEFADNTTTEKVNNLKDF